MMGRDDCDGEDWDKDGGDNDEDCGRGTERGNDEIGGKIECLEDGCDVCGMRVHDAWGGRCGVEFARGDGDEV